MIQRYIVWLEISLTVTIAAPCMHFIENVEHSSTQRSHMWPVGYRKTTVVRTLEILHIHLETYKQLRASPRDSVNRVG